MRDKISINLTKRPNLMRSLNEKETTKETLELIGLFMDLAEEALFEEKGIRWVDLPKKFHKDLTFPDLVRGILRGTLDVRDINEENFSTLGADLHPLALFSAKEVTGTGGLRVNYNTWRDHFQTDGKPNEESIAYIISQLLRYARYLNFKLLFENMKADGQINSIYRGLGAEHVKRLPFYPALRYQEKLYGELGGVGRFFNDIGAFNCGVFPHEDETCPACKKPSLVEIGSYLVCESCNAGFQTGE